MKYNVKTVLWAAVGSFALTCGAIAGEVTSIAILTPEEGTDFGWNQQGVDAAKAAGAAAGVEVIVAQGLGYGDVRATLREVAEEGAGLIIAHAGGYNTAATEIAHELNVPVAIVDSPNLIEPGLVADYTLSGHEGSFLAGHLAALTTRSSTVGIVVSGEPPTWNAQSAAFAQGVRAANGDIKVLYSVIGPAAYSDAAGGKRVTESLIAAGADIIFGQGNGSSFGMLQAVETTPANDGGKVLFIDVIGDKTALDKGYLLSSVIWDIEPVYLSMIADIADGSFGTKAYGIGLADNSVRLLQTGQASDDIWAQVATIRDQIVSGAISVDPIFDAEEMRALMNQEIK